MRIETFKLILKNLNIRYLLKNSLQIRWPKLKINIFSQLISVLLKNSEKIYLNYKHKTTDSFILYRNINSGQIVRNQLQNATYSQCHFLIYENLTSYATIMFILSFSRGKSVSKALGEYKSVNTKIQRKLCAGFGC